MRILGVLLRKEVLATFGSPIAYTVAAVFLLVLGYTFSLTLFATKVANLIYIFHQMYVLTILLVPALTMRAFAEERRNDTLELLLTAPVGEIWIVVAKFLAVYGLVLAMYCGAFVYVGVLEAYGSPDWGPIGSGYLALACDAALIVAIGLLMSSLTENQVVAAALTLGASLMLWVIAFILFIAVTWSSLAVGVKRLHDRDKSGWWILLFWLGPSLLGGWQSTGPNMGGGLVLSLAAGVIAIWGFVELGCLRGTPGPNQYGPDPLAYPGLAPPR